MRTYDESLKIYWGNYNVIETAKHECWQEERFKNRRRVKKGWCTR